MKNLIKTFESFSLHSEDEGFDHEGMIDHDDHHESENYMFFGNLETIKRLVEIVLEMDPAKVDSVLKNGHNWAVDHIVSSKDDVEEVANFLINEMAEDAIRENEEADEDSAVCENCGCKYSVNEEHVCE